MTSYLLAGKSVWQRQIVIPPVMTPMHIEERTLPTPLQQRMACNQTVIFKNPDLISKAVNLDNAPPGCIRDRIVIAADTDHSFVADPALKLEDRAERNQGQWLKCRHLLGEGFVDDAPGRGVQARIGDSAESAIKLRIEVIEISEDGAKEEFFANVAERPFNLAFGLWPVGTTGLWQITVMLRKFAERPVVEDTAVLVFADDGCLLMRIRDIAQTRMRYGYFRIYILLRREGWVVNHKRVYRLYREDGLSLRLKRPRRHISAVQRERQAAATSANDLWAMDFVSDALFDGRR